MYKQSIIQLANVFSSTKNVALDAVALAIRKVRIFDTALPSIVVCALLIASTAQAYEQETDSSSVKGSNGENQSTVSNDFMLPVTLDSKNQFIDGKERTSVFTGNVIIRQGSLEILADRVAADDSAGSGKEVITATGTPASYKQRLEDGSVVIASAYEIQYNVELQTISLKGKANIKQNEIKVNGDSITFDMGKEQIMASTDANSSESVTTVLSPGAFSSDKKSDKDKS